jgi:hypothetical protein
MDKLPRPPSRHVYGQKKRLREEERDHDYCNLLSSAKALRRQGPTWSSSDQLELDEAFHPSTYVPNEVQYDLDPNLMYPDSPYIADERTQIFEGWDIVDANYLLATALKVISNIPLSFFHLIFIPNISSGKCKAPTGL